LQGADRLPVVAELGVVVVLDDDRLSARGPVDEREPPFGGEDHAGRTLVGRGEHDRARARGIQGLHVHAAGVDGDRDGLEPGPVCRRGDAGHSARVLEADPGQSSTGHGMQYQPKTLSHSWA
jgi:hypothetical protein